MSDIYSRRSESVTRAADEIESSALNSGTANTVTVRVRRLPEREPNRVEFMVTITPPLMLPYYQHSLRRTYEWMRIAHNLPSGLPGTNFDHNGEAYVFLGASLRSAKPTSPFAVARIRDGERSWCSANFVRKHVCSRFMTEESNAGVFSIGVGESEVIFS